MTHLEPAHTPDDGTLPWYARTLHGRPLALAAALGVLILAAAGFAIAATGDGPVVAPQTSAARVVLDAGAQVLDSYPDQVATFGGTAPWPADQAEFRQYTQWLAEHQPDAGADPATLATVTYTLAADQPCLQTFDTVERTPVRWTDGQISTAACGAPNP